MMDLKASNSKPRTIDFYISFDLNAFWLWIEISNISIILSAIWPISDKWLRLFFFAIKLRFGINPYIGGFPCVLLIDRHENFYQGLYSVQWKKHLFVDCVQILIYILAYDFDWGSKFQLATHPKLEFKLVGPDTWFLILACCQGFLRSANEILSIQFITFRSIVCRRSTNKVVTLNPISYSSSW